jgi:hypothetical protein
MTQSKPFTSLSWNSLKSASEMKSLAVSSEASSNGSRAAGFTGVMYLEEGRKEGREEGREGKEGKGRKEGRKGVYIKE